MYHRGDIVQFKEDVDDSLHEGIVVDTITLPKNTWDGLHDYRVEVEDSTGTLIFVVYNREIRNLIDSPALDWRMRQLKDV